MPRVCCPGYHWQSAAEYIVVMISLTLAAFLTTMPHNKGSSLLVASKQLPSGTQQRDGSVNDLVGENDDDSAIET